MKGRPLSFPTLAVALAVALAGQAPVGAASAGLAFAQTIAGSRVQSGEPSIAVDPRSGAMYVTVPGENLLWRSQNGGASWVALPAGPTGGDTDIAVDAAGTVYLSALFGPGSQNSTLPVSRSFDGGRTWRTQELLPGTSGVACDRQWTVTRGTGNVLTSARCGTEQDVWISTDSARTFSRAIRIADGVSSGGPLTVGPGGSLWMLYAWGTSVMFAKSLDGGRRWKTGTVASGVSLYGFPVVDLDAAGNAYAAFDFNPGGRFFAGAAIAFTRSTDGGAHWSDYRIVSDPSQSAIFPWVSAGSKGSVDVSFMTASSAVGPNLAPPTTSWNIAVAQSKNANAAKPSFSLDTAAAGFHSGSVCTSGTGCLSPQGMGLVNAPGPEDRRVLDFFETALDKTGKLLVAYPKDRPISGSSGDVLFTTNDIMVARQTAGPRVRS